MTTSGPIEVTPTPSDDELAAILAAYEELWPEPVPGTGPDALPRWRFAGRWWTSRPHYGGWS
ncbi:MAG: hypothetical protein GWN79_06905 [Actinobacteria bacterium]|nr:hypothetical protein [Actinomycetota bacterium]NIS30593.1 hypothetical protein [Actinomycetota bacterium]NIT95161.1 hypothetical protein [Actinomycetota bacterium]NIU18835.1 hypothetical protein [Actinomycetota bacterium]NIU65797.1 hypothetical protein [Actinomycetota bacterium]